MAIQCRCVPTEHKSSQNARTLQVWRRRHCIGVQDQTIWTKVTASTNFTSANHHHLPASYKHEFKKSTKSANNSCEENKRLLPYSSAGFCHPANLMVWSRRFWKFHDGSCDCSALTMHGHKVTNATIQLKTQATKEHFVGSCCSDAIMNSNDPGQTRNCKLKKDDKKH